MVRAEGASDVLLSRPKASGAGEYVDLYSELSVYLDDLVGGVQASARAIAEADPFLAYLHGVLLKAQGHKEEAREVLQYAAAAWPLNWSAWLDLASCCATKAEVDATVECLTVREGLLSPGLWVLGLFQGHALLEVQARAAALRALQPLSALFPSAPLLLSLVARALYGLHRFDAALALLTQLRTHHPARLEDADTLSNILFVKGARAALAALAEEAWRLDRYRPETSIAVGNFHSLRGEHSSAALAFRRALRVAPSYATAWTLLGHEYVEMRNLPAACEAYRRAVDFDPNDYRAWYGLGQAYELQGLSLYAAYYYKRVVGLRPRDSRMWSALAGCYESLERWPEVQACLERAATEAEEGGVVGGGEGEASLKLARLHKRAGDVNSAGRCYARYVGELLAAASGNGNIGGAAFIPSDAAEALLFLARAALQDGDLGKVQSYASRILDLPHVAEEREARALLAELGRVGGQEQDVARDPGTSEFRKVYGREDMGGKREEEGGGEEQEEQEGGKQETEGEGGEEEEEEDEMCLDDDD